MFETIGHTMMRNSVLQWLEQAKADFKTANDNITSKNFYASVIFFQQCAEKSLKAVYILLEGKTPPKIHDLVELGRLVSAPEDILAKAAKLTVTYFTSRYPDAAPEIPVKYYTREKAEEHKKEAEVILQWAERRIK